jgi:hypothetical protein
MYIFTHDHRHVNYNHFNIRKNVIINQNNNHMIFHPNINYYNTEHEYYNLWDMILLSDNILDYCKIIENATEIHITDSVFCCICPYLDLSNVKIKCVYTDSNYDLINYHESFSDWHVIYNK